MSGIVPKKPAHQVVVEIMLEVITAMMYEDQAEEEEASGRDRIVAQFGALGTLMEVLKRIPMPEDVYGEVILPLRLKKAGCSAELAETVLPEEFFAAIDSLAKTP